MSELLTAIGALLGGLAAFSLLALMLFGSQIFVLLALREIRMMAATMPEKERQEWLNEALTSFGKGVESANRS